MWDVAAKDLLQLLRDRTALIMLIAVPLLLVGIFGTVLSDTFGGGMTVTARLPVVDHDGGPSARALIAALRHVPSLTVQMERNQSAEEKAVRNGDQVGLLIIPAGFTAALQSGSSTAQVTYYNVPNNTGAGAQFARDVVQSVVQRMAFSAVTARAVAAAQRQSTGRVDQAVVSRAPKPVGSWQRTHRLVCRRSTPRGARSTTRTTRCRATL